MEYRERCHAEYRLVSRLWQRYLSDWDYKLSDDVLDQIYFQLLSVLGDGSRQEIRDPIEEAKWIDRELQP